MNVSGLQRRKVYCKDAQVTFANCNSVEQQPEMERKKKLLDLAAFENLMSRPANLNPVGDEVTQQNRICVGVVVYSSPADRETQTNSSHASFFVTSEQLFERCRHTLFFQLYNQLVHQIKQKKEPVTKDDGTRCWVASVTFTHDQMIQSVSMLYFPKTHFYSFEVKLLPSKAFRSSARKARESLQRFLAFSLSSILHIGDSTSVDSADTSKAATHSTLCKNDLETLNLYSLAWLCRLLKTLRLNSHAECLEELLVCNLNRFHAESTGSTDKKVPTSDEMFLIMFLGVISAHRSEPLYKVLDFMSRHRMPDQLASFCQEQERKRAESCTQAVLSDQADRRDHRNRILHETARRINHSLQQYCRSAEQQEASNAVNTAVAVSGPIVSPPERTFSRFPSTTDRAKGLQLMALADTIVHFMRDGVVRALPNDGSGVKLKCVVFFDSCRCDIDIPRRHNRYRCFRVVRHSDSNVGPKRECWFSAQDVDEWLRYMLLLQLDARNVHTATRFLLTMDDCGVDFGRPPCLTFESRDAHSLLSYFLLRSEFRSSIHFAQRAACRERREQMHNDKFMRQFVCSEREFAGFIVVTRDLLQYAVPKYQLRTVQDVYMQCFRADK